MKSCTEEINNQLKLNGEPEITVYWLDRMLYIICSGKFFLHGKHSYKDSFLNRLWSFCLNHIIAFPFRYITFDKILSKEHFGRIFQNDFKLQQKRPHYYRASFCYRYLPLINLTLQSSLIDRVSIAICMPSLTAYSKIATLARLIYSLHQSRNSTRAAYSIYSNESDIFCFNPLTFGLK